MTGGPNGAGESGEKTRHWIAPVLVALIGAFMSILDTSIVNVAIPTIMNVFNVGTGDAQWIATIYMLALGVVVPMSGWIGDKLGFKRLYILAMAVFVAGSMLCTLSWSLTSLIVARVIQAIGGGMIMPTTMAMIYRMVPRDRIGGAMGIFGIALLVAPTIGPTLGGYLVEYVDWRWIFTINLPIGIIGILLSLAVLPDFSAGKAGKLDVPGALTSAIGLFCLLLALSKGAAWGWGDEKTVLLLYLSVTFLSLFVYIELTSPAPLLELRVFKYATFTFANLTVIVTTIGMFAGLFYLPLFLQTIRGLGAMQTGLLLMPGALISAIMMPITGRLYDKIGPRFLVVTGLLLLALLTYNFRFLNLDTPYATITLWIVLRGGVIALANMPAQTAALAVIPTELVSRASAMTNVLGRIASSFGIAGLTSVLTHRIAFHSQNMAQSVTAGSPGTIDYLTNFAAGLGGTVASTRSVAISYLYGHVQKLAFVKGIDDVFLIAAGLTLLGVVPSMFLKKGSVAETPAVAGE
jgi:EmrB/QacA subfamily drug resistance transporter